MTDNYQEIEHLIQYLRPFKGNSIWAEYNREGVYMVCSYRTPIFEVQTDGRYWFNEDSYSQTTSRHQNIVRRAIASNPSLIRNTLFDDAETAESIVLAESF